MKRRIEEKVNKPDKKDPRGAVVSRLLSMAELFRTQAKIPDEAQEALDWEKKLRDRAAEIEAGQVATAA